MSHVRLVPRLFATLVRLYFVRHILKSIWVVQIIWKGIMQHSHTFLIRLHVKIKEEAKTLWRFYSYKMLVKAVKAPSHIFKSDLGTEEQKNEQ